ncbi:uncharacterized protein LOC142608713 [Castanea sativa]|uniref:uncharacterized protein LOC142608713 n=1 Tax=Castanea sativa TaxID=21020 RepID=UPI003F64DB3A
MDNLAQSWKKLTLSDREGPGCSLTSDHCITEFSIAAKFLTKRAINVEVIARTFTPLWRAKNGFKIKRFSDHKLLFTFDNEKDVDRILASEPWSFDKHLVVMQKYDGNSPLQDIKFDRTRIWVQVHGIPLKYMSFEAGIKICEVIGDVTKPSDTKLFDGGNFIRLHVSIDLSLPLCHGRIISLSEGNEAWVSFKYRRLPNICYWCGRLTHDDRDCDLWIESKGTLKPKQRGFGLHLRAQPFVAAVKNVIKVLGFYAEKNNNNNNNTPFTDRTLGQLPQPNRAAEPKQPPVEEERYKEPINAPSMCNEYMEFNSLSKTETSSANPTKPMIKGNILEADDLDSALNKNEGFMRRFGDVVSVEEGCNNSNAREALSDSKGQPIKSRVTNAMGRVPSTDANKRVLPVWTRKNRDSAFAVSGKGQRLSGRELDELVQAKDPSIVFLAETLTNDARLEFIQNNINFDHRWVVPKVGRSGGLVLYWKASINLSIEGSDKYYIDAVINKGRESEWRFTGFYDEPDTVRRHEAWEKLKSLNSRRETPWLCCGDFNEIILQDEKLGGATRPHVQMQTFREVIDKCGFMDLGYEGSKYTWSRYYDNGNSIWEWLDQCLATSSWFLKFPGSKVYHLRCDSSDHIPLHVVQSDLDFPKRKKLFRFEEMWLSNRECEEVVFSAWNSGGGQRLGGDVLAKVEKCGKELTWWDKNVFGNVRRELDRLRKQLTKAESEAMISGSNLWVLQLKKEIDVLLDRESTMWAQWSRLLWARQGGRSTKYFHSRATRRYRRNKVEGIRDDKPNESQEVLSSIPTIIDEDMKDILDQDFSEEEVVAALKLAPLKASRSDGMPPLFYQHSWETVSHDVTSSLVTWLNIDMSKAYDRVDWNFLEQLMRKLGFPEKWIHLIMGCVKTVTYTVLVNGEPRGTIQPTRGIRQGDPLSPFLFLLCTEGLNRLIKRAECNGDIHGYSLCRRGPKLTHLLFADDSLLFYRSTMEECRKELEILNVYEKASGQKVNRSKTSLLFSKNTSNDMKHEIKVALGVPEIMQYQRYLGLPSLVGKGKKESFSYIQERVWRKLQG